MRDRQSPQWRVEGACSGDPVNGQPLDASQGVLLTICDGRNADDALSRTSVRRSPDLRLREGI